MNAMFLLCVLLLLAGAFAVSGCAQQGSSGGAAQGGGTGGSGGEAVDADDQAIAQGPPLPPE